MENINVILEKLMLNRAALLIKKYDNELKEILENDLQAYKAQSNNTITNKDDQRLVA